MVKQMAALACALSLTACANFQEHGATVAGGVGTYMTAKDLGYTTPEFVAGALIAYAIYDPFAPTWNITVTELAPELRQLDLTMKRLVSGGEGEARQTFLRNARKLVLDGGYAGYDIVRYEEGVDSSRPFARRVASGEIRLVRSRQFPEF